MVKTTVKTRVGLGTVIADILKQLGEAQPDIQVYTKRIQDAYDRANHLALQDT